MKNIVFLTEFCEKNRCEIKKDEPLGAYTSFKIGGPARAVIFPPDADTLREAALLLSSMGMPFTVLGNGSNVLVSDKGYDGAVIFTARMKGISAGAENEILAECGASLNDVCRTARELGISGFESLYGIPASIGGAVYMNAGAYDSEMADVVTSVLYMERGSFELKEAHRASCGFGYRRSMFADEGHIVLSCKMKGSPGKTAEISAKMTEIMSLRRQKQPLEYPSAGSVFKRSPPFYTAKLIDQCGLKGLRIGGAEVSEKHAGFIINRGGATADDVRRLVDMIKTKVLAQHGVEIECEIKMIGF